MRSGQNKRVKRRIARYRLRRHDLGLDKVRYGDGTIGQSTPKGHKHFKRQGARP